MTHYAPTLLAADDNGGTCTNFIDMSVPAEPPRISQVAPGLWKTVLPRKPVMLGHAADYHGDPDGPVLTDGVLIPPGAELPVQVCAGCDVDVLVAPGPDFTMLIADHRPGCARYAALAARRPS